ncbi:MAG TPA: type IV secretory system conjugative DNA transfer family protein [Candidatus Limnocylindrales bacterium]|nr:type IV secretory system conjugative DNA transfer family protein [Candidatus Limnocylindrales bacterium]
MPKQLAYSLGDPLPSGCKPYVIYDKKTGDGTWYSTCETPLQETAVSTQTQTIKTSQTTQARINELKTAYSSILLPQYMRYSDQQISSFLTVLPIYCIIVASVAFTLLFAYLTTRYLLLKKKLKASNVVLSVKPIKQTLQTAFATEQLFTQLHSLISQKTFWERFLHDKTTISIELVATKEEGIRYLIHTTKSDAPVIRKTLLSYLPSVEIEEVADYLPQSLPKVRDFLTASKAARLITFRLVNHFAIPLTDQTKLREHDPIAYLTGNMTKLAPQELISLQLVLCPMDKASNRVKINEADKILNFLWHNKDISPIIQKNRLLSVLVFPINVISKLIYWTLGLLVGIIGFFADIALSRSSNQPTPRNNYETKPKKVFTPTATQQVLFQQVQEKLQLPMFETSMRLLVVGNNSNVVRERVRGFQATLSTFDNAQYQAIIPRHTFLSSFIPKKLKQYILLFSVYQLGNRLLSFSHTIFLSVTELSSIYHLPYTQTTKTEDMVKSKSKELPAPHSFKKAATEFDVILGVNQYGGELSPIGITLTQRQKHMYVIGKTGTGKTTLLTSSIYQDMLNGKGLAVLDPHGDMIQELLRIIPENRKEDVIFFDPSDRDFPIGLNLLAPGIQFSNIEDEREWITSSVLAVFKKLADEKYWGPRMEHILRNTTLTALHTPKPTFFTLQRLLTEKKYQKEVAITLKDPVLKQFWQKEFKLLGSMQLSSVTAPLTQRLGAFISSKMSRHILLQEKSTINIQQIMDEGKILLINLSKGDLGEDQSFFFGTIITSLIWMASYQRTKIPESARKDFFVYIDEFQNFATPQFADITSEGRKFHVSLIVSHQNIAQIKDKDILRVVAGNAHIIVCTKASPEDESFILPFLEPEVEKGDIINLAPFNFFMKVTTDESEDAFSGRTVPIEVEKSEKIKDEIITYTRKHYATPMTTVEKYLDRLFATDVPKNKKVKKPKVDKKANSVNSKSAVKITNPNVNIRSSIAKSNMEKKPPRKDKESQITVSAG